MKIVVAVTNYWPYVSGLTIYVKRTAEELAARGHRVRVLCMRHDPALAKKAVIKGVEVIRSKPDFKINKGFVSLAWIVHAFNMAKWADVLMLNLPQAEGWVAGRFGKLLGKRVVAVYHCEIDMRNKLVQYGLEILNSWALKSADKVITYTEDYAKNSRLLQNCLSKTKYVYPPVPRPTTDKKLEVIIRNKMGTADVKIGVAARLAEEKGVEYLLESIPAIKPHVKVVIAGPLTPVGEKKYGQKIMNLVEKHKNRVVFLGTIDPEKMGAFYRNIDVLVLPSVNSTEAFGMVQVEAMLWGVPVVSTDLPGVRVPVKVTGMGRVVPPRNSQALALAINEIQKIKIRPTEEVKKIFNYERLFAEILG